MGVTSLISEILSPAEAMARSADSRPAPGPLTITTTDLRPCSMALAAASPAATWAANGVDLREPLKPRAPADDQDRTFPVGSVMVIIVLLKVELMWTIPLATFFLTRFFPFFGVTGDAVTGSMPVRLGTAGGADSSTLAGAASAFFTGFSAFSACFSSATLALRSRRIHAGHPSGAPARRPQPCARGRASGPCGCGHWCGCAGRGPEAPCGGEGRGSSPGP